MSKNLWIGAVALALFGAVGAQAQDKPKEKEAGTLGAVLKLDGGDVKFIIEGAPVDILMEHGKYSLGVNVSVPGDELRKKLELPPHAGLVVENVLPNSAAAKAGIKTHDVLLAAGDTRLTSVQELAKIVNESNGKELKIVLLRDGKKETIKVTPAKTGGDVMVGALPGLPLPGLMPGVAGGGTMKIQGNLGRPELPDDVTVSITKTGKEPAKIVVSKGKEKWEVTEKEVGKLPKEIRPYVDQMLGRGPIQIQSWSTPGGPGGAGGGNFEYRVITPGDKLPGAGPEIERRMRELNRQMEELRRAVDELRQGRGEKRLLYGKGQPSESKTKPVPHPEDEI